MTVQIACFGSKTDDIGHFVYFVKKKKTFGRTE